LTTFDLVSYIIIKVVPFSTRTDLIISSKMLLKTFCH